MGLDISFYSIKCENKGQENDKREEVAYFRKVNLLIPFFGYEDNCEDLDIDKCQVEDLLTACETVLNAYEKGDGWETVAEQELPTTAGFFFGSTDYDDYYIDDVKDVADHFTTILETFDFENEVLTMNCWW